MTICTTKQGELPPCRAESGGGGYAAPGSPTPIPQLRLLKIGPVLVRNMCRERTHLSGDCLFWGWRLFAPVVAWLNPSRSLTSEANSPLSGTPDGGQFCSR